MFRVSKPISDPERPAFYYYDFLNKLNREGSLKQIPDALSLPPRTDPDTLHHLQVVDHPWPCPTE